MPRCAPSTLGSTPLSAGKSRRIVSLFSKSLRDSEASSSSHCFNAFGAGLNSFARCQSHPLQIGIFSFFDGRVVPTHQFFSLPDHFPLFSANGALPTHTPRLYKIFTNLQYVV
jgi:hypothetical protein